MKEGKVKDLSTIVEISGNDFLYKYLPKMKKINAAKNKQSLNQLDLDLDNDYIKVEGSFLVISVSLN